MNRKIYTLLLVAFVPLLIQYIAHGIFSGLLQKNRARVNLNSARFYLTVGVDVTAFLVIYFLLASITFESQIRIQNLWLAPVGVILGYLLYKTIYVSFFFTHKKGIRESFTLKQWSLFSVITGLTEEFIWRAVLMRQARVLAKRLASPPVILVFTSAIAFAIYHVGQGPKGVCAMFVLGSILAATYLSFDCLLIPIIAHITYNFLIGTEIS